MVAVAVVDVSLSGSVVDADLMYSELDDHDVVSIDDAYID